MIERSSLPLTQKNTAFGKNSSEKSMNILVLKSMPWGVGLKNVDVARGLPPYGAKRRLESVINRRDQFSVDIVSLKDEVAAYF